MESKPKINVLICYKDRPTEIFGLLHSLMNQTYKNFIITIVDDFSGTPVQNYHFLVCLFNKMNELGHYIIYHKNEFNYGVSKSRQKCVEIALKSDCELFLRVDDDILLEPDYIEQLLEVINQGYDLASGVTPFIGQAQFKRESKFLYGVGNRVILNDKGEHLWNGDDCGMEYYDKAILPIHHFRSCALYKREIHEKVDYKSNLSKHGFREEQIFSYKCIINGFKLGFNTKAIAWHLLTPSGGERFSNSNELVKLNQEIFIEWTREMYTKHGDFIKPHNERLKIESWTPDSEELTKQNNLLRI